MLLFKKMRTVLQICLCLVIFGSVQTLANEYTSTKAQGITITGTIADSNGETMPGVNVTVKGVLIGSVSDINGRYSINVPNGEATLVFSFVGYTTQELVVGNQRQININWSEDTRQIEEVVVVGYGTQKKVNLTGSVANVDMGKMIDNRPITNVSSGLAGLSPGLFIANTNGGQPGDDDATIRIRGQGSPNNSDPLILIDGAPGFMGDLNPQDVASITILKDAASSAIYGSRAANGVILITTRKGDEGRATITYNGYFAAQIPINKVNLVTNYADYMEIYNEACRNTGVAEQFDQRWIDEWRADGGKDPIKYPNTDWQDILMVRRWSQNHTLSVNGGTPKIRYFISGNVMDNPGIIENAGYKRTSIRANVDSDVKSWLKVGINSYGYRGNQEGGYSNSEINEVFDYSHNSTPGMLMRHPDGRYGGVNCPDDDLQSANSNPLFRMNRFKGERITNKISTRVFGQLKPLKGLSIEGSYTYDFTTQRRTRQNQIIPQWNFYTNTIQRTGEQRLWTNYNNHETIRTQMDGVARYETNFGRLNVQAMAGISEESYKYQWFEAEKMDLIDPNIVELNTAMKDPTATGTSTDWAMRSGFGRISLNWDEKYLLEGNLRADWSSRFASGSTRRGVFPSFSAGWRISQEDFLKDVSWIQNLKVRASYGTLGNNAIRPGNRDREGNYEYMPLYNPAHYPLNGNLDIGFAQTILPNPIITWETTAMSNVGVDFALLANRLTGSFEYFNKRTKDILYSLPAPAVHGTSTVPAENIGRLQNAGIEIELGWNDRIGKFGYFVSGNFTFIRNKFLEFKGNEDRLTGLTSVRVGEPLGVLYIQTFDRIVQTQEDMNFVQAMVDRNPNAFVNYPRPEMGDLLLKDVNGDGVIDNDDLRRYGNGTNPVTTYGLSFGADWNGFAFTCLLQGVGGLSARFQENSYRPYARRGNSINKDIADGRWYEGRPDKATMPRYLTTVDYRNHTLSNFWVQSKDYLRVKNIQLSYTLPTDLTSRVMLEKVRFYVSIDNALTFTRYPGMDPELPSAQYPTFRSTTLGVNLTF